jgi:TPR repeat protein
MHMKASKWVALLALALNPLASFGWVIFPDERMVPDNSSPQLVAIFEEFKASAEKGDINAQFKLGFCYYIGCGIPKRDYLLAKKWFLKAADAGLVDAEFKLAMDYFGRVEQKELHFKYLYKAAAGKYPKAYYALGTYHENGWGVPRDELEAYAYFNLAYSDLPWAQSSCQELEKKMTPEQRLAGQKRSKEILKELEAKK